MSIKNKKLLFSVFVVCISFLSVIAVNLKFAQTITTNKNEDTGPKKILIDPGHGGIDGGKVTQNNTVEKNISLSIGIKLKKVLEEQGYQVVMTREEDIGLYSEDGTIRKKKIEDLNNRCKLKEETKCDLFISIHLNAFSESQYHGAQVWYSSYEESRILARIVQDNLKNDLDPSNKRKEKPANNSYKVLRCHDTMPGILVECGFLSNPQEEEKLKMETYQEQIANSLGKSIHSFFKK